MLRRTDWPTTRSCTPQPSLVRRRLNHDMPAATAQAAVILDRFRLVCERTPTVPLLHEGTCTPQHRRNCKSLASGALQSQRARASAKAERDTAARCKPTARCYHQSWSAPTVSAARPMTSAIRPATPRSWPGLWASFGERNGQTSADSLEL